jgi:hypothetical protein
MTTISSENKTCAVCRQTSKHVVLRSTNTLGQHPDLDTRPPEMLRSTIQWWVQTCPSCGYCYSDISQANKAADKVVESEQYKKQLNDTRYPKLANAFLCLAMIHEADKGYREAGWACIHAAWACDDEGPGGCAQECRKKALVFIEKTRSLNQKFTSQPGAEDAITVDLLRRSGQFELALSTCEEALKKETDDTILGVLRFEKALIGKRDSGQHTMAEIST